VDGDASFSVIIAAEMMRFNWRYGAILAILLLACGLRVYRLGAQELWGDEGGRLEPVLQDFAYLFNLDADMHPRLFHASLYAWYHLFGFNEFGLRMLAVLFALPGVALLYRLGRQMGGWKTGAWAAGLLALSPFHVYYSQDLTQYTLLFTAVAATFFVFSRIIATPYTSPKLWVSYALIAALAMHAHYYSAFALAAQAIYVLLYERRRLWRWMWVGAGMLLLVLPWFVPHYFAHAYKLVGAGASQLRGDVLISLALQTARAFIVGATCPAEFCTLIAGGYWLVIVVALAGLLLMPRLRARGVLLGLGVLIPMILVWITNTRFTFYSERFAMAALPPTWLLLAWGLTALPRPAWSAGLGSLPYAFTALVSLQALYFNPQFVKSTYGAMLATVAEQVQPGDIVLLNGPQQRILFDIYRPPDLPYAFVSPDSVLSAERADRDFPALISGRARAWLVMFGAPETYDPDHRAEAWLANRGFKAYYESFPGAGSYITLYLFSQAATPLTSLSAQFAPGPRLDGYSVQPASITRGTLALFVALQWSTAAPIADNYTVFVHLLNGEGQLVAQSDSEPVSGTRPTSGWRPGEAIRDQHALQLPPDLPAGDYTLVAGMYDWRTGERLLAGEADAVHLTTLPAPR
jgi:4-amino-4-deoxy-L-arabinose transferase-like glycosyltransferase